MTVVGVLHPGEMGAALGAELRKRGHDVVWASEGRSAETRRRATSAELADTGSVAELLRRSQIVLSVCPPHAAQEVAESMSGFDGVFVDANAISPATARTVGALVEAGGADFVDGGIVGPPPPAGTRLYLAGERARDVAALFDGTAVDAVLLERPIGSASALKMTYAGWTKGTAALLLALRAAARAEGVEDALLAEWAMSLPELPERSRHAARSAAAKGWRWVLEMEEIAATLAARDLPAGFHEAAADVFARVPRDAAADAEEATVDLVVAALLQRTPSSPRA